MDLISKCTLDLRKNWGQKIEKPGTKFYKLGPKFCKLGAKN